MIVLAIDPGLMTGVAMIQSDLGVLWQASIPYSQVTTDRVCLLGSLALLPNQMYKVVIEKTPTPTIGAMNFLLRTVLAKLEVMFPDAEYVPPGVWKNSRFANRNVPGMNLHEIDAACLGFYYIDYSKRRGQCIL